MKQDKPLPPASAPYEPWASYKYWVWYVSGGWPKAVCGVCVNNLHNYIYIYNFFSYTYTMHPEVGQATKARSVP